MFAGSWVYPSVAPARRLVSIARRSARSRVVDTTTSGSAPTSSNLLGSMDATATARSPSCCAEQAGSSTTSVSSLNPLLDELAKRIAMKTVRLAVLAGAFGIHCATALAQVPQPDPLQGDGRVSPFYTWSGELAGPPGRLLQSEPVPATLGLANAARQERI